MQTNQSRTLAGQFRSETTAAEGYDDFFRRLLAIVGAHPIDDRTGAELRAYVLGWLGENSLREFDRFSDEAYQRTYLGRCPASGWEAIVMSWKQGNTTTIHSHPQFAGYNFADGEFRVEVFEPAGENRARLKDKLIVTAPHGFYAIGQAGRMDNHIHRITCLSDTGHSLHVYSDNALKGLVYEHIEA